MGQHTPGSWTVDIDHKAPCYNVRTKVTQNGFANPVVCTLWDDFCTDAEAEANAYLIAASPSMYDALKAIALDLEHNGEIYSTDEKRLDILYHAIRMAEGK